MDIDDVEDEITRWVKAYQGDTLVWHADALTEEKPWSFGWVDVLCEELQEDVPCNWVWTIETPGLSDGEVEWNVEWAPDLAAAFVCGGPAWSAEAISAALTYWAGYVAERPDIKFLWNPSGPKSDLLLQAEANLAAIEAGAETFTMIRPGASEGGEGLTISASDDVMDFLLSDPDEAAHLVEAIAEYLDDLDIGDEDPT